MSTVLRAQYRFPSGQRLEITQGDITSEDVEAIVNAANAYLQHGAGVAGAIVRKGGYEIQRESDAWVKQHGPVTHERPAYTTAGKLPFRYIIHAVGPIWGEGEEENKLSQAIQGSLQLAERLGLRSLAFPAISTGIFGMPKAIAARVFLETIARFFAENPNSSLALVRITLLDTPTLEVFLEAFNAWQQARTT